MAKKYKNIRVEEEIYNLFSAKRERMQSSFKEITQREAKIPMTKVLLYSAKTPIYLKDEDLVNLFKKEKRGHKYGL